MDTKYAFVDVLVKGVEEYKIINALSIEEAKLEAIDRFHDDDLYCGSEIAKEISIDDCEIRWCEET